jgi:hypothetical protein
VFGSECSADVDDPIVIVFPPEFEDFLATEAEPQG